METAAVHGRTQGYIALDGCSLTVGEVKGDTFCVYLIPETLSVTTFGTRQARRRQRYPLLGQGEMTVASRQQ